MIDTKNLLSFFYSLYNEQYKDFTFENVGKFYKSLCDLTSAPIIFKALDVQSSSDLYAHFKSIFKQKTKDWSKEDWYQYYNNKIETPEMFIDVITSTLNEKLPDAQYAAIQEYSINMREHWIDAIFTK